MSKYIRIIYLYVICFITLLMIIAGFINTVNAVATYIFPSKYNYYYDKYDSDYGSQQIMIDEQNKRTRELKNIITSASILVVATPLFFYHWSKIENERKKMEV